MRADVDIRRHQYGAGLDKCAVTNGGGRHNSHTLDGSLERDFVVVGKRPVLNHFHLLLSEIQQNCLLNPAMDHPAAVGEWFGEADRAGIQQGDCLANSYVGVCGRNGATKCGFDGLLDLHTRHGIGGSSARRASIAAATSSVG